VHYIYVIIHFISNLAWLINPQSQG